MNDFKYISEIVKKKSLTYCRQFEKCSACKFFRGGEEKCKQNIMLEVLDVLENNNNNNYDCNVVKDINEKKWMDNYIDNIAQRAKRNLQ